MSFPCFEPKKRGDHVETVHPCNIGRQKPGTVLGVEYLGDPGDERRAFVSVRVDGGGHVYGPAVNWRTRPPRATCTRCGNGLPLQAPLGGGYIDAGYCSCPSRAAA